MTMSNSQRVGDDALQLLSKGLAPFVQREFRTAHRENCVLAGLGPGSPSGMCCAATSAISDSIAWRGRRAGA